MKLYDQLVNKEEKLSGRSWLCWYAYCCCICQKNKRYRIRSEREEDRDV